MLYRIWHGMWKLPFTALDNTCSLCKLRDSICMLNPAVLHFSHFCWLSRWPVTQIGSSSTLHLDILYFSQLYCFSVSYTELPSVTLYSTKLYFTPLNCPALQREKYLASAQALLSRRFGLIWNFLRQYNTFFITDHIALKILKYLGKNLITKITKIMIL